MYKNVYLRKGKEESLLRFHPWIFSGAISHSDNDVQDGEIVRVVTAGGNFIAVGHFQMGSIAVRVLSFEDEEINRDFWKKRLAAALRMRGPAWSSTATAPPLSCRHIAWACISAATRWPRRLSR